MNSLAFTPAATYLLNDHAAQAYIRSRPRIDADLQALKADQTTVEVTTPDGENYTEMRYGYVTVIKTARGWMVDNMPAVGFVAVQAYILARYW